MGKMVRRGLAVLLAAIMVVGCAPIMGLMAVAESVLPASSGKSGDDGTTNWDFIVPVTHQKTVPDGYIGIYTAQDLDNVRNNLTGNYILMNDIDLGSWGNWEPIGDGVSHVPVNIANSTEFSNLKNIVGTLYRENGSNYSGMSSYSSSYSAYYYVSRYYGNFDGNGYVVKNMTITVVGSDTVYAGLFGQASNSEIKNVGMANSSINISSSSYSYAGGIIGRVNSSSATSYVTLSNCYNAGDISASTTAVSSFSYAGGFIGYTYYHSITISNCYNTGDISSSSSFYAYAGGFIGSFSSSAASPITISHCHNTGDIGASNASSYAYAGGFIGDASTSSVTISNCHNTGDIGASNASSYAYAGGFIGSVNSFSMTISNCYNTGDISARYCAGGIIGYISYSTVLYFVIIDSCYNTGDISTTSFHAYTGGIIGFANTTSTSSSITISNCYYLNNITSAVGEGSPTLTNVISLTDTQMRQQSSYVGFDFDTVWKMPEGGGYPILRWQEDGGGDPTTETYTITYNANGGTGAPAAQTKTKGVPLTLSNTRPTRTGYTFLGWTVSNIASTAQYQPGGSFTTDTNTTLYAVWQANTPTTDIYNLGEETYRFNNYGDNDSPKGHCFGMASTSAGYYLGLLDIATIGGTYSNLYSLSATSTVKAPICYYHKRQGSYAIQAIVAGNSYWKTTNYDIAADWTDVINYVKNHTCDDKGTLQVVFWQASQGGHTINFLRYEEVGGQPRIYAYDNNCPDYETYFYKDAQGLIRQAPYSTFSGPIDSIGLSDVATYFSVVDGFDATRVIYADRGAISVESASVYPMTGDIELGERVMFEIPAHMNQVAILPLVNNATFEYLDDTYSFGEVNPLC